MKNRVVLVLVATLLFSVIGVAQNQAGMNPSVRYTDSNNPTVCLYPASLPSGCSALNTGVICTSNIGSVLRRFFQDATLCITPYYREF